MLRTNTRTSSSRSFGFPLLRRHSSRYLIIRDHPERGVLRQVRCHVAGLWLSMVGSNRRPGFWTWSGPRRARRSVSECWGRTTSCRPASPSAEGDWSARRGCPEEPDAGSTADPSSSSPAGPVRPRAAEARWEDGPSARGSSPRRPDTALEQLKQLKPTSSGFITHLRNSYSSLTNTTAPEHAVYWGHWPRPERLI